MNQPDLFCDDRTRVLVGVERREQGEQLERVSERIAGAIEEWFDLHSGQQFRMERLREYVVERCGPVAPGSPDRVMRSLRQTGRISYVVESRGQSLYRCGV